jgi:hypothetical protein
MSTGGGMRSSQHQLDRGADAGEAKTGRRIQSQRPFSIARKLAWPVEKAGKMIWR